MSVSDLETRIGDWVASNAEWTMDSVDHTLTERNTKLDNSGRTYYGIDVRFELTHSKANLVQKLADKLKEKVDWYCVGYHNCSHDSSDPLPCSWDDSVKWTAKDATIPTGVPTFEVDG